MTDQETDRDPEDAPTTDDHEFDEAFGAESEPEPTHTDGSGESQSGTDWNDPPPSGRGRSLEAYAELAALVGLGILAAVAVAGLYTSTSTAVDRLVATRYEPLFQAAFNLVVLLVAAVGLSLLWRRRASAE